jgi:alanine-synthesizing transaminase
VPYRNHFRVTLLPEAPVLREVFARIDRVLSRRAAAASTAPATGAPAPAVTAAA